MKRLICYFITLFFCLNTTFAQQDSIANTTFITKYFTKNSFERNEHLKFLDTTLQKDEIFHPMYKQFGVFQDLGNQGTAVNPLWFEHNKEVGFELGGNPFKYFFKTPQQANYYNTRIPLTDFKYTQGPNDFLLFSAVASANITPNVNVGVDYTRNTGRGFYRRQNVNQYFTQVFGSYKSNNNKFALMANYNWNQGIQDENGGLVNDSLFETLSGNNKAAPLRLRGSESRFKNRIGNLNAYYYFGKPSLQIVNNDSNYVLHSKLFLNYEITHQTDVLSFFNKLGDTSNLLFPNRFYDTTAVFSDSVNHNSFSQNFSLGGWLLNNLFFYKTGIIVDNINVFMRGNSFYYTNIIAHGLIEKTTTQKSNQLLFSAGFNYAFAGYNQNDFKIFGSAGFMSNGFLTTFTLQNHLYQPDFVLYRFASNPFLWSNNFNKINLTHFSVNLQTKKFRNNFNITYQQFLFANYVFVNELALPQQTGDLLFIQSLKLEKVMQWKRLFFDHLVMYQQSSSNIIRLPDLSIALRYYADFRVLKVLQLQVGSNIFYNTAFYGNAYNPVSRLFYLQNQTLIGNYPLAEVFVTALVKKASFYVKFGHINANLINSGFYYTPSYPLPLRALYLGLRWRMYN